MTTLESNKQVVLKYVEAFNQNRLTHPKEKNDRRLMIYAVTG
jgi:hypothetical protein